MKILADKQVKSHTGKLGEEREIQNEKLNLFWDQYKTMP